MKRIKSKKINMRISNPQVSRAELLDYVTRRDFNDFREEFRDFTIRVDQRFAGIDQRMDGLENRLARLEKRFDQLEDSVRIQIGAMHEQFKHDLQLAVEFLKDAVTKEVIAAIKLHLKPN